jgi:hypothetical protein
MTTVRMLSGSTINAWTGPPGSPAGRTYYQASAGTVIDVPDVSVSDLRSQGLIAVGDGSGPTSGRPTSQYLRPGYVYVDTTIGLIVAWDGANWRNPLSGATA